MLAVLTAAQFSSKTQPMCDSEPYTLNKRTWKVGTAVMDDQESTNLSEE